MLSSEKYKNLKCHQNISRYFLNKLRYWKLERSPDFWARKVRTLQKKFPTNVMTTLFFLYLFFSYIIPQPYHSIPYPPLIEAPPQPPLSPSLLLLCSSISFKKKRAGFSGKSTKQTKTRCSKTRHQLSCQDWVKLGEKGVPRGGKRDRVKPTPLLGVLENSQRKKCTIYSEVLVEIHAGCVSTITL